MDAPPSSSPRRKPGDTPKFGNFLDSIQTAHLIAFSSLPICLGALAGYKSEMKRAVESSKKTSSGSKVAAASSAESAAASIVPPVHTGRLAAAALGIGTLCSIGGFGLLTAAVFHFSGCQSLEELIDTCRTWAPNKRKQIETTLGMETPKSMQHEDVKATAHMDEDEEWEYLKKKYIPDMVDSDEKKDERGS